MDVKAKVKLSEDVDSYWDILPWHISLKILNLKIRQEYLDEERSSKRKELCEEIRQFHTLKTTWGLGWVYSKPLLVPCPHGCKRWFGRYVNVEGRELSVFLAFELDVAIKRCNHIKSFIYPG